MLTLKKNILFLFLLGVFFQKTSAQLLTELGQYHNQVFVGTGYTNSFANVTYGINHVHYFKIIKREIAGILDFTSPISNQYFTRFIFRKGFQIDAFKKGKFRLPVAVITSTERKREYLIALHNILTTLYILPGVYTSKYTIAADISAKFLLFQKVEHDRSNRAVPIQVQRMNIGLGIILARNIQRFSLIFRGGFQQISEFEFTKAPVYAIGTVAYRFNFKKQPVLTTTQPTH